MQIIIQFNKEELENIYEVDIKRRRLGFLKSLLISNKFMVNQQLTVDIVIEQVYYQFLTSPQFTKQEILKFLIKFLISLSYSKVQDESVILAEGKIKKDKYLNILNHIQDQILTCTLYPEAFEQQNDDENSNIFDDIKNYRGDIVFNSLFCSSSLVMAQNALKNLFDYLETSASEFDLYKFIELS